MVEKPLDSCGRLGAIRLAPKLGHLPCNQLRRLRRCVVLVRVDAHIHGQYCKVVQKGERELEHTFSWNSENNQGKQFTVHVNSNGLQEWRVVETSGRSAQVLPEVVVSIKTTQIEHIRHRRQGSVDWTDQWNVFVTVVDNLFVKSTLFKPNHTWLRST